MLTFNALRAANVARIPLFRNAQGRLCHNHDGSDCSVSDWLMALVGELGELANFLKKVKRGDYTEEEAAPHVAKELADVQIYLDILAFRLGVDLGRATQDKFNEVSARVNCDVFIGCAPPSQPAAWINNIGDVTTVEPHAISAHRWTPLYR